MPDRSEKVMRLNEETGEYELPYISKSRVIQWIKNPEHFRLKYLEGISEPENAAMVRGSRIHEAFEGFYEVADGQHISVEQLPENRELWADFIEPYISNFLNQEARRLNRSGDTDEYLPVGIEIEHWRDPILGVTGEPEWMGIADVLLPAASFNDIARDDGVVIVDFKTGSVPDPKYRDDGIYTELAYYHLLFEDEYDVAATAAYYPREDTFLVQDREEDDIASKKEYVRATVGEMITACNSYTGSEQFEATEGPLCGWSPEDGDRSSYYGVCSQCTWNVPVDNRNAFEQMIEEGYSDHEIADDLGTSTNAINYWKYKLNL